MTETFLFSEYFENLNPNVGNFKRNFERKLARLINEKTGYRFPKNIGRKNDLIFLGK